MEITKKYSNGEMTIVWKPKLCIHSTKCVNGLPNVFNLNKKPWINADGATTNEMINQVKECPSGALSFFINSDKQKGEQEMSDVKINLMENGPILVNGVVEIKNSKGEVLPTESTFAMCRCGNSGNKPFCDGTHVTTDFKG